MSDVEEQNFFSNVNESFERPSVDSKLPTVAIKRQLLLDTNTQEIPIESSPISFQNSEINQVTFNHNCTALLFRNDYL